MELDNVRELYLKVLSNISKVIVGKELEFSLIFTSVLAGGHILLEDNPGTGKTTLAKCIAKSIDAEFKRVQFTPDLMPQDIIGLNIYSQKDNEFHLVKGPVFTNILLADEINRATPRTQSSLLEAMEERQVTIDSETLKLSEPFVVIATENPVETTGTYPLPEAELDRFMMKLSMGALKPDEELAILERFILENPIKSIASVINSNDICEAREEIKKVFVHKCVMKYMIDISNATRSYNKILVGVSPRASLALLRCSQAFAAISGRKFVTPDDVRFLAPYVLAHRIITYTGINGVGQNMDIIKEVVDKVEVPVENWEK